MYLTNLSALNGNSLITEWLRELRDVNIQGDRMRFRRNIERIGEIMAYEISKFLEYKQIDISTPISDTSCNVINKQPVVCTILRAGIPLYQGLLNYFDKADSGFIGSYRKHTEDSFVINQQYIANPSVEGRPLILADTMLGTGSSMIQALEAILEKETPSQIHIVSVIAASRGIKNIQNKYPDAFIWTGDIDLELTSKGYLIPGLGDAGDLAFGPKNQF